MEEDIIKNDQPPASGNFNARLLEKIKEEKMTPKPRWQFLLKDYVVWTSGLVALLIGAAAISVMIYLFKYNDWDLYELAHKTFAEFFLLTLPYFWFIFLVFFFLVIYYNFRHTKGGYRYPFYIIAVGSIAASVILGFSFYAVGLGEKIDDVLGRKAPFYDQFINRNLDFWSNPEEGRLAGLIVSSSEDGYLVLVDRQSGEWIVTRHFEVGQPFFEVMIGQPVRMIGQQIGDHEFQAVRFWPMVPAHGFFDRVHDRPRPPLPPFER